MPTEARFGLWMSEQSRMNGHAHLPPVSTAAVYALLGRKLRGATSVPVGGRVSVGGGLSIQVRTETVDRLAAVIDLPDIPASDSVVCRWHRYSLAP